MMMPLSIARSLESTPEQARIDRLIAAIDQVPQEFILTPTYRKAPIRPGWNKENLSRAEVKRLLKNGAWFEREDGSRYRQEYNGIAAINPGGFVFVDIDGKSAHKLFAEIAGQSQPDKTVAWSSGKPHNGTLTYSIPASLQARMDAVGGISKIRLTECATWKTHGSDAIELLLKGSRATLPPSAHPETNGYEFKLGWDYGIQPAPAWLIELIEAECAKREYWAFQPKAEFSGEVTLEQVQQWLALVQVDDLDYDSWIKVGLAIKGQFPHSDGLQLWEQWSQGGANHKPGDCEKRWEGFINPRIPIAYLARLAGYELRVVGAGVGFGRPDSAQSEAQRQRDRLIARRMMVYRSNYKEASDKAIYLGETPEDETSWYQGFKLGDPLKPELCAQTILIQGGLGSGKTESVLRMLEEYRDRQIIWISGRRNLNAQTEQRANGLGLETYNYQSDVATFRQMLRSQQSGLYFFCGEGLSQYHTQNIHWGEAIVILDEFSGVRAEIASAGAEIFSEFEKLLSEAGTLVAIDAHLSDFDVEVLEMYRSGKSRVIYRQSEQKSAKKITWLECRNKDGAISLSHDGTGFAWAEEALKAGQKIAIATDSKLAAKAVALHLEKLGYKGILATSETIEQNGVLFANPDEVLADPEIRFFAFTPVSQSGLDVQSHFGAGILLYHSVVTPDQALQMMGRCRNCDDWMVSAPRRSLNPSVTFNALTDAKIAQTAGDLFDALAALNPNSSAPGVALGTAQAMLNQVWAAYGSEALQCLLQEKFETVEMIELSANPALNREYSRTIKGQEAKRKLEADEARGMHLVAKQQAPFNDADYWAIEAAKLAQQFPEVWARCKNYATDPSVAGGEAEAIEIIKVLSSNRLGKLYRWVEATISPDDGLAALTARLGVRSHNPNNPSFRRYQNLKLFRTLNLVDLACAGGDKAIANETHFNIQSPQVKALYEKFRKSPALIELFPQVENIANFWAAVRRCMSSLGYQSAGKTIRVESATPAPNGRDRHGNQRYSMSRSMHFSGWLPMEESGSKLFRSLLPEIVEAIQARLQKEYTHNHQGANGPPDEAQVA